jgi:hypothetical protein
VLIVAACLTGLGLSSGWQPRFDGEDLRWQSFKQLRRLPDMRARALDVTEDYLGSVTFTQKAYTRYEFEDEPVDVFIGLNNRTVRHTSLISPKTMYLEPGLHLPIEEQESIRIGATDIPATLFVLRRGPTEHRPAFRILALHWYKGTRSLPQEALRSALALDWSPFRRSNREIVLRISTPMGDSQAKQEQARKRIDDMVRRIEVNLAREPI